MLLYLSTRWDGMCGGKRAAQLPGDVTLEAANDFLLGTALGASVGDVSECGRGGSHPHDRDGGECPVQAAVATAGESVSHWVSHRRRDGQGSPGGAGAAPERNGA